MINDYTIKKTRVRVTVYMIDELQWNETVSSF